ncbi:hypothetical protein EV126DRAFT_496216 [Verticillium dahliae]|nr:hypothetical protein EV126DRAFT_496216 [Verticillium dahliae]
MAQLASRSNEQRLHHYTSTPASGTATPIEPSTPSSTPSSTPFSAPSSTLHPSAAMSTIASPRDPSVGPLSRRISNQPLTPTGSARPSLDSARSATTSPRPSTPNTASIAPPPAKQRANRAALREYYNLKKQQQQQQQQQQQPHAAGAGAPPTLEVTQHSEVPASELDTADFDADAYVQRAVEGSSLAELLTLYTRVLGEVRALDAEKKALVLEAQRQWEMPRRLLVVWRDAGVGGADVQACMDEGDAAVGRAKSPAADRGGSKDDSS